MACGHDKSTGKIVVAGGFSWDNVLSLVLNTVEIFDVNLESWNTGLTSASAERIWANLLIS